MAESKIKYLEAAIITDMPFSYMPQRTNIAGVRSKGWRIARLTAMCVSRQTEQGVPHKLQSSEPNMRAAWMERALGEEK